MIRLALRNLSQEPIRMLISGLGVAFAVLLLAIISGILTGIERYASAYIDGSGADVYVLQAGVENVNMAPSFLPNELVSQVDSVPGVAEAKGVLALNYIHGQGEQKIAAYIIGYDPATPFGGPWRLVAGRAAPAEEEVVVDRAFAFRAGVGMGDTINVMGRRVKIVGLSRDTNTTGGLVIFLHEKTAREVFGNDRAVNMILVRGEPGQDPATLAADIHVRVPDVSVPTRRQLSRNDLVMTMSMIAPPVVAMQFISFLVGIMVLGLTIFTATTEKLREFAVLKAIGASPGQLITIVLAQSLTLSVIGLALGLGLAAAVSRWAFFFMPDVPIVFTAPSIAVVFALTILMGCIAAYLPVRRVLRLDPAIVFQSGR